MNKQKYRKWIRENNENLFQGNKCDRNKGRRWRTTKLSIVNAFIEEYKSAGSYPEFLITSNYYYKQTNRNQVVEHHKRMTNVINDFIKPTNNKPIYIDHFTERHQSKQVKITDENAKKVFIKDTLTGKYEDDVEFQMEEGGFHTHTIVTEIDDDKLIYPNSKILGAIQNVYGTELPPTYLRHSEEGMKKIKIDLLNYEIRKRCDFLGHSIKSLVIDLADEKASYDSFPGWKGLVAYCLKDVYNVDTLLEVYDDTNASIFPK